MAVLRLSKPFKDSVVILAFPGLGYVGTIAGRYIVEKLNLSWVGYVYDEKLPPVGKVKDGSLLYPVNVFSGNGFHVILSEVAIPEELVWPLATSIVSRARKDGAKYLLVLSGVLLQRGSGVYAIPSGNSARQILKQFGFQEIENGVITGTSAAVLLLSREAGLPAILLLGPASSPQDFNAAINVVNALSSILSVDIPTDELVELSHRYEQELRMLEKRTKEPQTPMYG